MSTSQNWQKSVETLQIKREDSHIRYSIDPTPSLGPDSVRRHLAMDTL